MDEQVLQALSLQVPLEIRQPRRRKRGQNSPQTNSTLEKEKEREKTSYGSGHKMAATEQCIAFQRESQISLVMSKQTY